LGAFAPKERFHSSYNYWQKYMLFSMFAPQKLGTVLATGQPFEKTKLAFTFD